MKNKLFVQKMPWWGWVIISVITIFLVVISYTGYAVYNKQNEETNKLLHEISFFKGESEKFNNEIEKLNSELEKARIDADNSSKQSEKASRIIATQAEQITEQDAQIDKEEICRQANDLFLEIKRACGIEPFPGVDKCIEEMKPEYLSEEECEKYGVNDKINNLKELESQYLPLKNQCGE